MIEAQKALGITLVGLEGYIAEKVDERFNRDAEENRLTQRDKAIWDEAAQYVGREAVEAAVDYSLQDDKDIWRQKWRLQLGDGVDGIASLVEIMNMHANVIDTDRHPSKMYTALLPDSTFVGIETPNVYRQNDGIMAMQEAVQLLEDLGH